MISMMTKWKSGFLGRCSLFANMLIKLTAWKYRCLMPSARNNWALRKPLVYTLISIGRRLINIQFWWLFRTRWHKSTVRLVYTSWIILGTKQSIITYISYRWRYIYIFTRHREWREKRNETIRKKKKSKTFRHNEMSERNTWHLSIILIRGMLIINVVVVTCNTVVFFFLSFYFCLYMAAWGLLCVTAPNRVVSVSRNMEKNMWFT